MKTILKKMLPDAAAVVFFVAVGMVYFWKPVTEGLVLTGNDHSAAVGSNVEMEHYRATHHGERTRWTNALFSGMPTYQSAPAYDSTHILGKVMNAYHLWLPENVWYVFVYLLGFYLL